MMINIILTLSLNFTNYTANSKRYRYELDNHVEDLSNLCIETPERLFVCVSSTEMKGFIQRAGHFLICFIV